VSVTIELIGLCADSILIKLTTKMKNSAEAAGYRIVLARF
jgi:hypothetical protein